MKGFKNLIAFISLLLIQKKCIQKIVFLKVCLGVGFLEVESASAKSKKNYVNLWFILLQVIKGF